MKPYSGCCDPPKNFYYVQDGYKEWVDYASIYHRTPVWRTVSTMPSAFEPCQYDKQWADLRCPVDCPRRKK